MLNMMLNAGGLANEENIFGPKTFEKSFIKKGGPMKKIYLDQKLLKKVLSKKVVQ